MSIPGDHTRKDLVYRSPGEKMGEGDTELILDILPSDLAAVAFEQLSKEVAWNVMKHHGELGIMCMLTILTKKSRR